MTAVERVLEQNEHNKELVRRCYDEFFAKRNLDTVKDLLREDFIQHSPNSPSGKAAYLDHLRNAAFVGAKVRIQRIIADGEYVAVHHHMTLPGDDGPGLAVVDIWRIADGQIAEHWDVEQPIPDVSNVPNGML